MPVVRGKTYGTVDLAEIIKIDGDSEVAVFRQVAKQVVYAVASGRLCPGDLLSPIYPLSYRLGIDADTIYSALRRLESLGVVDYRLDVGFFVRAGVAVKCRTKSRTWVIERLHTIVSEAKAAGMDERWITGIIQRSMASDTNTCGDTSAPILRSTKEWDPDGDEL